MRIPKLTMLQFVVLIVLSDGEKKTRLMMEALVRMDHIITYPALYKLMQRMEVSGLITHRKEQRTKNGQSYRESFWLITNIGKKEAKVFRAFVDQISEGI